MKQYKDITYTLERSDRKTASIYIERDGQVSVLVPKDLDDLQVEQLLESKRHWIYKNQAEWEDLNATRVQREFVSGEGFLYLGRSYRLKLVDGQTQPLLLKDGTFRLDTNRINSRNEAEEAFRAFYREKGRQRIPERVQLYQGSLDVEPSSIHIQELHNRWASCTPGNRLNFHWKCMMAPLTILDYIVVHELVHIIHLNHTDAFWNEVDKLLPDYRKRREWLRQHGAGMNL